MNKSELAQAIKNEGKWDRHQRSPAWEKAFESYNSLTGSKLRPTCGGCFNTVKKWLQS